MLLGQIMQRLKLNFIGLAQGGGGYENTCMISTIIYSVFLFLTLILASVGSGGTASTYHSIIGIIVVCLSGLTHGNCVHFYYFL